MMHVSTGDSRSSMAIYNMSRFHKTMSLFEGNHLHIGLAYLFFFLREKNCYRVNLQIHFKAVSTVLFGVFLLAESCSGKEGHKGSLSF